MSKLEDLIRLNMYIKTNYHGKLRDYRYDNKSDSVVIIYRKYNTREIKTLIIDTDIYTKIIKGELEGR